MTDARKKLLAVSCALSAIALLLSCNSSFFLRGAIDGDCDPPRTLDTGDGGADPDTVRMSNCQVASSVCCRVSSKATRTSCQYPEDCYVAPYLGTCATAVDCSDTQDCVSGTCQCTTGGPPCPDPVTQIVTCCAAGLVCNGGMCGDATDAGL